MRWSVLLVDDNQGDLDLLRLAIDDAGWDVEVTTAPNGQTAAEQLRASVAGEHLPDLVILDLNMPGVTGFDLLRLLQDDGLAGVRRVVLTSSNSADDELSSRRLGADGFFTKPPRFAELVAVVETIRRTFESGANARAPA